MKTKTQDFRNKNERENASSMETYHCVDNKLLIGVVFMFTSDSIANS